MSFRLLDRARVAASSAPGTSAFPVGSAQSGFQTFSAAGANNGDTFPYVIEDGSAWEYGLATYSSSGPTFSRSVTNSSSGVGTAISASSSAIAYCSLRAEDFISLSSLAGTPPSVVQFNYTSVAASTVPSVTMGAAPTNGDLLVAFVITDASSAPTANTNWTLQSSQTSGLWYFQVLTKKAGASESTTQSPVTGGSSAHWTVGIYEVSGQNATSPIVSALSTYVTSISYGFTPGQTVSFINTIALMCIVPAGNQSYTCSAVYGCKNLTANLSSASGAHAAFGWTDSNSITYTMSATFSSASGYDAAFVLLTA